MTFVSMELSKPKHDLGREWPHSTLLSERCLEYEQCSTTPHVAWEHIRMIYIQIFEVWDGHKIKNKVFVCLFSGVLLLLFVLGFLFSLNKDEKKKVKWANKETKWLAKLKEVILSKPVIQVHFQKWASWKLTVLSVALCLT